MPTANFTVSRARIARVMLKVESTYGSAIALTPADDGLLVFDSSIIWSVNAQRITFLPNQATFTQRRDFITERVAQLRFKCRMQGSGSLGVEGVAGFRGLSAALQACAMKKTATGGASITYTPAAIADIKSVTVWVEHHGQVHKVAGAVGDVTITGNTRSGLEAAFTLTGLYYPTTSNPKVLEAEFDAWDAGEDYANPFLNAGLTIDNGGGPYTPVGQSFQFVRGVQLENVPDFNVPNGIQQILVGDAAPTLTVVIKQDNYASTLTYADIFTDLFERTTHAVSFDLPLTGGATGQKIGFDAPSAQLLPGTNPQQQWMHRDVQLQYKLQSDTNEGEFTWTIT